jgi:hypothetical protein
MPARHDSRLFRSFVATVTALAVLSATSSMACDGNPVCIVKDPTGTPLNIRQGPNGKIVGNAGNGTRLEFIDHIEDKGKLWARVAKFDEAVAAAEAQSSEGYFFASYLDCGEALPDSAEGFEIRCTVNDPTGTPLNYRAEPNGEIYGSVRNGTVLRVFATKTVKGKLWANAYRLADDNAIGWVFDDYLKCEENE